MVAARSWITGLRGRTRPAEMGRWCGGAAQRRGKGTRIEALNAQRRVGLRRSRRVLLGGGSLRPLAGRGRSSVEMAHEPGAVWKLCLADSSPPGLERGAVGRAEGAHGRDRLEKGAALPAADGEGRVTFAKRFPAFGSLVGRQLADRAPAQGTPALGSQQLVGLSLAARELLSTR